MLKGYIGQLRDVPGAHQTSEMAVTMKECSDLIAKRIKTMLGSLIIHNTFTARSSQYWCMNRHYQCGYCLKIAAKYHYSGIQSTPFYPHFQDVLLLGLVKGVMRSSKEMPQGAC